jgi:hypothetical protein
MKFFPTNKSVILMTNMERKASKMVVLMLVVWMICLEDSSEWVAVDSSRKAQRKESQSCIH